MTTAILWVLFGLTLAASSIARGFQYNVLEDTLKVLDDCQDKSISLCFKERALKFFDNAPGQVNFGGGLSILPTDGTKRSARYFNPSSLPEEPNAREEILDAVLMDRIVDYLGSHTFQFKVPEDTIREFKRSFQDQDNYDQVQEEEGRGKKKKKVLPILLLLKMKAAAIGAVMLKAIALLAFKALVIAKIALLLSSIIALKKLVDHKHTSGYEVISAHPYEDHGHHFDRSFDKGELPYRGYAGQELN